MKVSVVFFAFASATAAPARHGCDARAGRVALMPNHIGHKLEAQLEADFKRSGSQADGCNNCRHAGCSPVWAAPGNICDMQGHMTGPTIHFQGCSEHGYATDYKLEDHVKLCLSKEEIDWLWNHGRNGEKTEHGHCQTKEGKPHLGDGPEGLLVCGPLGPPRAFGQEEAAAALKAGEAAAADAAQETTLRFVPVAPPQETKLKAAEEVAALKAAEINARLRGGVEGQSGSEDGVGGTASVSATTTGKGRRKKIDDYNTLAYIVETTATKRNIGNIKDAAVGSSKKVDTSLDAMAKRIGIL